MAVKVSVWPVAGTAPVLLETHRKSYGLPNLNLLARANEAILLSQHTGPMTMSIEEWLERAGFGEYADVFMAQNIDVDILDQLTESHLKELGVALLGDRLRLVKIIDVETGRNIHAHSIPLSDQARLNLPGVHKRVIPERHNEAERRQLTIMFCDLADSTALSTRLDPEELADVIRAYQVVCTQQIQMYEGFIAKFMGDGILAYFGYPQSHERNAERAVLSALGIVQAIGDLNRSLDVEKNVEIAVRIGIATGMVMVGEIVGEGLAQERTVVGEAPNMAARLQGIAARNCVVIGSLTRELSGNVFAYEDLGSHVLKGITGEVQAWGVSGLRDGSDYAAQFEGDGSIAAPVLVGRDEEIGLLRRAWQSTRDENRGHVVLLSGEGGIGKSSLIEKLKAEVRAEGLPQMTMRCSPYHVNSALYPIIEHFKHIARWQADDDSEVRLNKLERLLERYGQPLVESVPLMASLLSLTMPEHTRYQPLDLSPSMLKRRTQDMIIGIPLEDAENQPFLQLWEDLHWADPSTLELIGLLIEQAPTASLLMVLTTRPDSMPSWDARLQIMPIVLKRLERCHAEVLINRIVGEKQLPAEMVEHIVTKSDGVPLYVEELTKSMLASDILRDTGNRYELKGPLSSLAVPYTLQDSLMTRLDRLPQVRDLALLASVLGREFDYEMIRGLATLDDIELEEGLGRLVDTELLYQRGCPPRAHYIFKHALIQDAAYGSLLRRTREQYHLRTAKLMETKNSEWVETHPDVIAHHYNEARFADRAFEYLYKAGQQSLLRFANDEAIAHLGKGLEVVRAQPDETKWEQYELQALIAIAPALVATKGYAAPDVEPAYRRALELSEKLGDSENQFSVLLGLSMFHFIKADILVARDLAEQAVNLARHFSEPGFDLAAARQLGLALCFHAEFEASRICSDHVATSYDITIHGTFAFLRGGSDFGVGAMGVAGIALVALGFPDQSKNRCAEALVLARTLEHPISEAYAHWVSALTFREAGRLQESLEHAKATMAIAKARGLPQYVAWISALRGLVSLDQGHIVDALAEIHKGRDANFKIGARLFQAYWAVGLADAYGRNDQIEQGLATIVEALDQIAQTQERYAEAELHRVKGQLLLLGDQSNVAEAEACFRKAIEIAQSQKAKMWELRAATRLALLLCDQSRVDQARDILMPVHDWFTEGFETADLVRARGVLEKFC